MRLRSAVACVESCIRFAPQSRFPELREVLPTLAQLLYSVYDEQTLVHVLTVLAALSAEAVGSVHSQLQATLETGVSRRVVEMLMHKSISVKTAALAVVTNICRGDDVQRQLLLNCSVLGCLLALPVNPKRAIRHSACVSLAHLCLGNMDQIQMVVDTNIIPPLMSIMRNEGGEVQRAALAAIARILTRGSDEQVRSVVRQGVIGDLCDLLTARDADVILLALDGLEAVLRIDPLGATDKRMDELGIAEYAPMVEECGGLVSIEGLQSHDNKEICTKAAAILTTYFNTEKQTAADDRNEPQLPTSTAARAPSGS